MSSQLKNISLPSTGFIKLQSIIGCPSKNIPAIIPVSRSTWYRGVNSGNFPQKIKIGSSTVWRIEDILALVEKLNNQST